MPGAKSEILQGPLNLMVLKTLGAVGPFDGCGIARRMEQISEEVLLVNQGTISASISGAWGRSNDNRKAKLYSITRTGRKQLSAEARNGERVTTVMGRVQRIAERG
jgi:DNA-binding PadR family transcriptional regulator